MKGRARHIFIWALLRPLATLLSRVVLAYSGDSINVDGPFLLLSNHNTDLDPLLVGCCSPKQMYFVASEHVFRFGFFSKFINWAQSPISRLKGTTAGSTVLTIMRRLKAGYNVCIFVEGNRSFNGVTGDILPASGKLARSCGASLVTFRFEGGYLSSPRWAGSSLRKGKMRGHVVNVYSPEVLKSMSVDEVNAAIRDDLHEDAFSRQKLSPASYRGQKLAEYLERVLCVCPKCGALDTMHSHGNSFSCSCGYSTVFGEDGFFHGENDVFRDVKSWDDWQTEKLIELSDASVDAPVFSDENIALIEILQEHNTSEIGRGAIALYTDRLELPNLSLQLSDISGIALHGPQTIDLSVKERSFEVKSDSVFCARKYMTVIEYIKKHSEVQ